MKKTADELGRELCDRGQELRVPGLIGRLEGVKQALHFAVGGGGWAALQHAISEIDAIRKRLDDVRTIIEDDQ